MIQNIKFINLPMYYVDNESQDESVVLNTEALDWELSTLTLRQKFADDINSNVLLIQVFASI